MGMKCNGNYIIYAGQSYNNLFMDKKLNVLHKTSHLFNASTSTLNELNESDHAMLNK